MTTSSAANHTKYKVKSPSIPIYPSRGYYKESIAKGVTTVWAKDGSFHDRRVESLEV